MWQKELVFDDDDPQNVCIITYCVINGKLYSSMVINCLFLFCNDHFWDWIVAGWFNEIPAFTTEICTLWPGSNGSFWFRNFNSSKYLFHIIAKSCTLFCILLRAVYLQSLGCVTTFSSYAPTSSQSQVKSKSFIGTSSSIFTTTMKWLKPNWVYLSQQNAWHIYQTKRTSFWQNRLVGCKTKQCLIIDIYANTNKWSRNKRISTDWIPT